MKRFALLAVSLLAAAVLAEIIVRALDVPLLRSESRVLLTSVPVIRDEHGGIRYPPKQHIRNILVGSAGVEFDTRFETNDLGLIDYRDYRPSARGQRRYAFVGDSYTAGDGASAPWVPQLRDELGIDIYNLGMGATGVGHFHGLLASVSREVTFTDIYILALSDDFFRPNWYPDVHEKAVRLCLAVNEHLKECRHRRPTAYLIEADLSSSRVVAVADSIRRGGEAPPSATRPAPGAIRRLLKRSRLLVLAKRVVEFQLTRRMQHGAEWTDNLHALAQIRAEFGHTRIRLLQVPDKDEVRRGGYHTDLREAVERRGIDYTALLDDCKFPKDGFHVRDNHPNDAGYRALAACVATYVKADLQGR